MAYLALARRWRPRTFAEVVGQDHVVQALSGALRDDRVHHALLFSGTRGVGKTTIARALAKSLNCEQGPTPSPCGECSSCVEIAEGRHVDLIEIDAASRTKVEDTRELLENVQYRPTRGRYKIYLIDEVHMLSRHSFNALLKTLEEPPAHVKFLLATTDPQKLPVTVLSRCLQFHLRSLSPLEISGHLAHVLAGEGIAHEPAALDELAAAAKGSLRDALSLTDQAVAFGQGEVRAAQVSAMLGTARREGVAQLVRLLAAGDAEGLMVQVEQLAAQAVGFERLLTQLAEAMHRIAMIQFLGSQPGLLAEQPWPQLAEQLEPAVVQLYYRFFLEGRRELPLAPDPRLALEMTLLRALAFRPATDSRPSRPALPELDAPSALNAQLAEIEAQAATLRSAPAAASAAAAPAAAPAAVSGDTAQVLSALQLLRGQRSEGAGEPPKKPERSPLPAVAAAPSAPVLAATAPARMVDDRPPWLAADAEVQPVAAAEVQPVAAADIQPAAAAGGSDAPTDDAEGQADEAVAAEPFLALAGEEPPPLPADDELPPLWDDEPEPEVEPMPLLGRAALLAPATEPLAAVVTAPPPAVATATTLAVAEQWQQLALQLGLKGLALQLALNSELHADGPGWLLRIAPEQRHLAEAERLQALGQAISQALGGEPQLRYEFGPPLTCTPAQARNARLAARRESALAALAADPFVQQLQQQCGATLASDSLQLFD